MHKLTYAGTTRVTMSHEQAERELRALAASLTTIVENISTVPTMKSVKLPYWRLHCLRQKVAEQVAPENTEGHPDVSQGNTTKPHCVS